MSIEIVLAKNLDALMLSRPELNSQLKLSRLSGVGQTTVGRIRRADGAATIDNVQKIARVFHLTASDLIDPRLLSRIGQLKNLSTKERAMAIAMEIQDSDLNDAQLTILANTLAAMRSQ